MKDLFVISRSAFLDALVLDADNKTDIIQVHHALEKAVVEDINVPYKTVGEWVSVEDRLPEEEVEQETGKWSRKVLFWCEYGYEAVGYYNFTHGYWMTADEVSDFDSSEVTHWMPLPAPPKGGN